MRVFVKNLRGEPLMPCSSRKARLLLKQGKATIVGYTPFTIQLQYATGEAVQPVTIGVDSGAKHMGIAIATED
uniref:RRXRR domain-containing protein n=1 Tax=Bacillus cereus group sp. BfR-BA-01380 TaxID=2920324 RepID=UPI001F59EBED